MSMDHLALTILSHVQDLVPGVRLDEVVLRARGSVEKTSSGKVKRKAMQKKWEVHALQRLGTASGTEAQPSLTMQYRLKSSFNLQVC
jgi:hypothetical protein